MYRKLLLLGMAFFLCGCLRPGAYHRPAPPVPNSWPEGAAAQAGAPDVPEAASVKWQEFFTDRGLQSVIELALANNRDLRIATLNIERVQALYRIQRAEQFPTVSVSAAGDLYRLPKSAGFAGLIVPEAVTVQQYNINLGAASWELDLFGRVRSLKSAALERFLATEQARSATQIALVAAVANSYLALAADRENLRLAQDTLATQQASYELILRTREAGMASDLDVRQAQSQVEAARVDIARYTGQVELDENALNLLAGTTVPANLLPGDLDSAGSLKDIGAGLPSEVLLRRPDILMAEHQLKAAYANIGAARAAFFPRIALTAGAGLMSADLSDLFKFGAKTWNFAPQVALPIFDAGARKANLKVTEVDREAATAEYEKAIQSAFREVSDSLSLRTTLMEQQSAQQELVKTVEAAYRLSEARYKAGIDSYLSVLVAQRLMYSAQQGLIGLRMARLGNLVTLYKVLGGGA
ncbi:MAG TPA: efflux transporter outer membrane subunit [Bryobacteraceae bacterium]|nr:efflux transporter outer membrane subunit [Bryobacteraceae bacterium]